MVDMSFENPEKCKHGKQFCLECHSENNKVADDQNILNRIPAGKNKNFGQYDPCELCGEPILECDCPLIFDEDF